MATEEQADAARQALLEQTVTLEQRVRDLANIMKGGIDVGQSGELGDLALLDNASQIPQFAAAALAEMQKYGLGAAAGQQADITTDLNDPLENGLYYSRGAAHSPQGNGYVIHQNYTSEYASQSFWPAADNRSPLMRSKYDNVWGDWRVIYTRDSIVGVVTNDGDLPGPQSAIFEVGENSNGIYVKYADGRLTTFTRTPEILTPDGRISSSTGFWSSSPYEVDFPHQFLNGTTPVVEVTAQRNEAGHAHWATLGSVLSNESCTVFAFSTSSSGSANCHVVAHGYWR